MDVQIDLQVVELLASRLCHDLVGPIGAVNNGMELLEDEDMGPAEDAVQLAANSARQAANALQFYRLAYGMAGARIGADLGDLKDLAAGFLASSKVELEWAIGEEPADPPDGLGKLLLNLIALAEETLPRGGTLTVDLRHGERGLEARVTAAGKGARIREDCEPALAPDAGIEDLTPRNVHGYFTRLLARRMGTDLTIERKGPDELRLLVALPA